MSTQTAQAPKTVKRRKAQVLPSKTTLNLMIKEKHELALSRWLPWVLIIVILAALFGKFAVADRFSRLAEAENALDARNAELDALVQSTADFDQVKEIYNQYTYRDFDRSIADRQDILDLLEREVFPHSQSQAVTVNGNVFSTTLTGITLDEVSGMMARLEADPLVESVAVSTAGYDDPANATQPYATMTIVFTNAEGGAE